MTDATPPAPTQAAAPETSPATPRPPGTIFRSELDRATGRGPGYLLRQLAPTPYRPAGRFQGWQITQVFPDDPQLCGAGCDLRPGDVIITVNGNNLERPEQLTKLFASLPELSVLEVHRVREGKAAKVEYNIATDAR